MNVTLLASCLNSRPLTYSNLFRFPRRFELSRGVDCSYSACRSMQLRQSGFRTAGEIRNPGKLCLLNLESRVLKSAIRSPTNDWNSKSKFKHWVPGIGNPWHGIQNPRLCLIQLHRATAWFSDMSEKSRKPPPFLTMCQENSIDSSRCHSDRVENTRIKWLED